MPSIAPVILPDIYRIFCESERFTVRTRARAVEIFTTLTSMICTMGEVTQAFAWSDLKNPISQVNKSLQKSLLNPVLSTFSEALVASLCVPDSHTSDAGLRTEVLNTFKM